MVLYGPPGTGKTLLARACAAETKSTFLKLAGPQLVQMFIGDGAKLVRDAFALAKEKAPTIIFIDELDAIGTKRFDSEISGDREVQRTMLELLNQLDGFSSEANVKVRLLGQKGAEFRVVADCIVWGGGSALGGSAWRRFLTDDGGATTLICRSLRRPTVSIFWIRRCCARVVSIARSSCRIRTRRRALRFCTFTRAR